MDVYPKESLHTQGKVSEDFRIQGVLNHEIYEIEPFESLKDQPVSSPLGSIVFYAKLFGRPTEGCPRAEIFQLDEA